MDNRHYALSVALLVLVLSCSVASCAARKDAKASVCAVGKGKRYHYDSCRYVRERADRVKLTIPQAKAKGLTPCKVCKPPA